MTLPDEERRGEAPSLLPRTVPEESTANPDKEIQQQALQMLTLAQQTAEDHVAEARHHADVVQKDARATAEQMIRDAQAQADVVRREGDRALSEARTRAAVLAEEAQAHLESARRHGDELVAKARARAAGIEKDAQEHADRLAGQAQLRYEETVGKLAAKREALQHQIEALQDFDRDYRSRLLAFLQAQVRALWVDLPFVEADIEQPADPGQTSTGALPAMAVHPKQLQQHPERSGGQGADRQAPRAQDKVAFPVPGNGADPRTRPAVD